MIDDMSFDEIFKKIDKLSGKWAVSVNSNKYFVRYVIEKDNTEYTFTDTGKSFKKCIENIACRIYDFIFNKKDTFSSYR